VDTKQIYPKHKGDKEKKKERKKERKEFACQKLKPRAGDIAHLPSRCEALGSTPAPDTQFLIGPRSSDNNLTVCQKQT
jgi:hypothetical protein